MFLTSEVRNEHFSTTLCMHTVKTEAPTSVNAVVSLHFRGFQHGLDTQCSEMVKTLFQYLLTGVKHIFDYRSLNSNRKTKIRNVIIHILHAYDLNVAKG